MNLLSESYRLEHYLLSDDGRFPNNDQLPVIIYRSVFNIPSFLPSFRIKSLLEENGWTNSWKGGIYTYHHYHSNTPEFLAVYKGKTILLIGGVNGIVTTLEAGDAILIPPGVAHKNLGEEDQIGCVGAYPGGRSFDMFYGKPGERPAADRNIETVPVPDTDPLFQVNGPLHRHWRLAVGA
jgi:uncharacterized protein YjlB